MPRHTLRRMFVSVALLAAALATVGSNPAPAQTAATGSGFGAVTPTRITDTRPAPFRVGSFGRLPGGGSIDVPVAGVTFGSSVLVPSGSVAVAMTVTAVDPAAAGYLTVSPSGAPVPEVSNLNFPPGENVANLVQVALGGNGRVLVTNGSSQPVDVLLDLLGYYGTPPTPYYWGPPNFRSVSCPGNFPICTIDTEPFRLFDTDSVTKNSAGVCTPLATGPSSTFPFVGECSIDASTRYRLVAPSNDPFIVANLTIDRPSDDGFGVLYDNRSAIPNVSTVNFRAGQTRAATTIVTSFPGTSAIGLAVGGPVRSARAIVDYQGGFRTAGNTVQGGFVPLTPCRAVDTRPAPFRRGSVAGPIAAGTVPRITLAGVCGLPPAGQIRGVAINITSVNATVPSHVTLWSNTVPRVSNVNFGPGDVVANHATLPLRADGTLNVTNNAGSVDLIVDVFGYYKAAEAP